MQYGGLEIIVFIIFVFFCLVFGGKLVAKYLLAKGKIHQCKTCGDYILKEEIEKHFLKKHMDGA